MITSNTHKWCSFCGQSRSCYLSFVLRTVYDFTDGIIQFGPPRNHPDILRIPCDQWNERSYCERSIPKKSHCGRNPGYNDEKRNFPARVNGIQNSLTKEQVTVAASGMATICYRHDATFIIVEKLRIRSNDFCSIRLLAEDAEAILGHGEKYSPGFRAHVRLSS